MINQMANVFGNSPNKESISKVFKHTAIRTLFEGDDALAIKSFK